MSTENADMILPGESGRAERALAAGVVDAFDFDVAIRRLWNPATCPVSLLPWLAWALSVDSWDQTWSEEVKRKVVTDAFEMHRRKGTVAAVRAAVRSAGYGDATVIEDFGLKFHNGTIPRNGSSDRSAVDHWAEYRVILSRPISVEQAEVVRKIIGDVAPARCHLKALDFLRALYLHDGSVPRNGTFTRGVA